jgi:hypothetical protein
MLSIIAQLLRAVRKLHAIHHSHHKHVMVGHRLVHVPAASARSGGPDRACKPQSGAAASRVAEGAADERRGECYAGQNSA